MNELVYKKLNVLAIHKTIYLSLRVNRFVKFALPYAKTSKKECSIRGK